MTVDAIKREAIVKILDDRQTMIAAVSAKLPSAPQTNLDDRLSDLVDEQNDAEAKYRFYSFSVLD